MRGWHDRLRGFYGVLDRDDEDLARRLLAVAPVLQVRRKHAAPDALLDLCRRARGWTREAGALLVVNDHVDLAVAVGADAVHLGQGDTPLAEARARAPSLRIGVSTHDLAQVEEAVRGGADYLGYGPVFATSTKERPDPVQGLDALAAACRAAAPVPVVAIGGITPDRAPAVAGTGAAAACAISAVNDAADPIAAARTVAAAFAAGRPPPAASSSRTE